MVWLRGLIMATPLVLLYVTRPVMPMSAVMGTGLYGGGTGWGSGAAFLASFARPAVVGAALELRYFLEIFVFLLLRSGGKSH